LKVISGTINSFVILSQNTANDNNDVNYSGPVTQRTWGINFNCRIRPKGLLYAAQRDLLAIVKYLVRHVSDVTDANQECQNQYAICNHVKAVYKLLDINAHFV